MALEERELADPDELGERRNRQYERGVKRFQGGLVSKAHRVLYNSTLGSRVIKKKKKKKAVSVVEGDLDELGERRNVVRPFLRTIELLEARLHFAAQITTLRLKLKKSQVSIKSRWIGFSSWTAVAFLCRPRILPQGRLSGGHSCHALRAWLHDCCPHRSMENQCCLRARTGVSGGHTSTSPAKALNLGYVRASSSTSLSPISSDPSQQN